MTPPGLHATTQIDSINSSGTLLYAQFHSWFLFIAGDFLYMSAVFCSKSDDSVVAQI